MICPTCKKGLIKKIRFKVSKRAGYLCPVCEALWFAEDVINASNAKTISLFMHQVDHEYEFEDWNGQGLKENTYSHFAS